MSCGDRHVCIGCFFDEGIRNFIEGNAISNSCSFCGDISDHLIAAPLENVIDHIRTCILEEYDEAINHLPYESAEGGYIGTYWDTYDLLRDELEIELPRDSDDILFDALVNGLGHTDWCYSSPFSPTQYQHVRFSWEHFCQVIMHERRFFFIDYDNDSESDEILSPAQTLKTIFKYAETIGLFVQLPSGTVMHRARHQKDGEILRSSQQLGPPLENQAIQSNRMSPPGIVMCYTSDIPETALRETVSEPGIFIVGEFTTRRDAIILDFGQLPPIPSLFEGIPDSLEHNPRNILIFLHHIVREISKPIERSDRMHIDYVPTQVVTEYVRSNTLYNNAKIDGIRYPSAGHLGHFSYVIFATQENILSVEQNNSIIGDEDRWIELISYSEHNVTQIDINGWSRHY